MHSGKKCPPPPPHTLQTQVTSGSHFQPACATLFFFLYHNLFKHVVVKVLNIQIVVLKLVCQSRAANCQELQPK